MLSSNVVLLVCALTVHCFTTLTWWAGGRLLGLSKRSAEHWMLGSIANGVAIALIPLHQMFHIDGHFLIISTVLLFGLMSIQRGMQYFLKIDRPEVNLPLLCAGVAAFNLLLCWPMGWFALGTTVSALILLFFIWKTFQETHHPVRLEFGQMVARIYSGLLIILMLLVLLTAIDIVLPELELNTSMFDKLHLAAPLMFVLLILSILQTYLEGYMVVNRLVRKLEHLSHHDSLTGLLNRRAFEYLLARECHRLQRFNEEFSLLILDIDFFKRVNDRLGHAAGDAVLQRIAETLQGHAREVDRVARFGGEEFCVLLPRTGHDGAWQAAERLRTAIKQVTIAWGDEQISVTISTGVVTAVTAGEAPEALLERADQALYRAKSEGRNCVMVAPDLVLKEI